MKKTICLILTLAMVVTMSVSTSITVFAQTNSTATGEGDNTPVTEAGGSKEFSVKGTYKRGEQADTVYSVDVTWGSMEFTYTDASGGTWDPQEHKYVDANQGFWSCESDANKITVTNRSNTAIDAGLSYTNVDGFNLTAAFEDSESATITKLSLPTAEAHGETESGPRTASAYMKITEGEISSSTSDMITLGTITVTISDAE